MTCTFCDAPLPVGARYCPNCGTAVEPDRFGTSPGATGPYDKPDPVYGAYEPAAYRPTPGDRPAPWTSTTAVLSLLCGIAGWSLLPVLGSILAVIFGHRARREIDRSGGLIEGRELATFGLFLGYLLLIPVLLASAIALAVLLLIGVAAL